MRRIGLIGGMSWESTLEYYRLINQGVKAALGGHHAAARIVYSAPGKAHAPTPRLQPA